jgi:predicted transcriptional regulator
MTTKEAILDSAQHMPEDATIDDALDEFYVRQKIKRGLEQIERGETVSHEQAKLELQRWLK